MAKFILTSTGQLVNLDQVAHAKVKHGPGGYTIAIWFVNDRSGEEGLFFDGKVAEEIVKGLMQHHEVTVYGKPDGPPGKPGEFM